MSNRIGSAVDIPWRLRVLRRLPFFNAIAKFLLEAGVPMGFNGLLTVRGRKSGMPRTTPVAIIAASGRRWVWAPWGEVQWVRNLRAAGRATISAWGTFAISSLRSHGASRSAPSSSASWTVSISTIQWQRLRVALSSNSTQCDEASLWDEALESSTLTPVHALPNSLLRPSIYHPFYQAHEVKRELTSSLMSLRRSPTAVPRYILRPRPFHLL